MKKKIAILLIILISFNALFGCYSYVSLDKMTIVAGVGIDLAEDGEFETSFEIVDIAKSSTEFGLEGHVIQSKGKTIFDAIRNARKQLPNKLYIGNNSLLVISRELAERKGITAIVDFFMRDEEGRETVSTIITETEKAVDILRAQGHMNNITSYALKSIVERDVKHLGTIHNLELYKLYKRLIDDKSQIYLPLVKTETSEDEKYVTICGTSLFRNDKMIDLFNCEESKYFLFAIDQKKGGILTVENVHNSTYSLEIFNNKTKMSYKEKDGQFTFNIKTTTDVYLGEDSSNLEAFTMQMMTEIIEAAQKKLEENIKAIIKKVQNTSATDVFGFSDTIYRKNPKLWHKIENDWTNIFRNIEVNVMSEVNILNTAYLK